MPTRPVTWELDIPPANLLEPAKETPPAGEVPSLDKLRTSLMETRFELLKISTFAACLLALVGVAIHGSHLANPDNQFAANTGAAIRGLAMAVSHQAASLYGKTEALALAAVHETRAVVGHATGTSAKPSSAEVPAVMQATHLARAHHKAHAVQLIQSQTASLQAHHSQRGRPLHADLTNPDGAALHDPSSKLASLVSPDSLVAGIAALLLYMIFVVVLVRIRGGLRATGGDQQV